MSHISHVSHVSHVSQNSVPHRDVIVLLRGSSSHGAVSHHNLSSIILTKNVTCQFAFAHKSLLVLLVLGSLGVRCFLGRCLYLFVVLFGLGDGSGNVLVGRGLRRLGDLCGRGVGSLGSRGRGVGRSGSGLIGGGGGGSRSVGGWGVSLTKKVNLGESTVSDFVLRGLLLLGLLLLGLLGGLLQIISTACKSYRVVRLTLTSSGAAAVDSEVSLEPDERPALVAWAFSKASLKRLASERVNTCFDR